MKKIDSKTIVFIPGAFISNRCWDDWLIYFEKRGYTVFTPSWPEKDADAATLRASHPDEALADVSFTNVIDHYATIIKRLAERPIIIGHSLGGLIAQILMDRGLAAGVVAIHPAPPLGIFPLEFSFIKYYFKSIGLFSNLSRPYMISFVTWQETFTNGMDFEQQKKGYYDLATPESKCILRGLVSTAARINFDKPHEPLLIMAGRQDKCFSASLCERVFQRYRRKDSITEFVIGNRNHFVLCLNTWREDAMFINEWIRRYS